MKINPVKEKLSRKKKKLHTEKMLEEVFISFLLTYGPHREKTCLWGVANNTGADQPTHLRSLVCAFVICFLESFICKLATGEISFF